MYLTLIDNLLSQLGLLLTLLSLISLSMILNKETKDFINERVGVARRHGILLLGAILVVNFSGTALLLIGSEFMKAMMVASSVVLSVALIYIEASTIYTLIKNGYYTKLTKEFIDVMIYMTVLWLLFDRLSISWAMIGVASSVLMLSILYFAVMIEKYLRIASRIVVPVNLFFLTLGTRLFSAMMGLHLAAFGHSEGAFRGFIAISYLVLSVSLWYTLREIRELVKVG
jgi:hypothetical protein